MTLRLTSFSRQVSSSDSMTIRDTDVLTESPIQPKGPRVPESPHRAQSLRGHPFHINGIFSSDCSHWFVERVAVICLPPEFSGGFPYFPFIPHTQFSFAACTPGAHAFTVRSTCTYPVSLCGPCISLSVGVYCSAPDVNSWRFFSPICDTCGTVLPLQHPCIAIAYS